MPSNEDVGIVSKLPDIKVLAADALDVIGLGDHCLVKTGGSGCLVRTSLH